MYNKQTPLAFAFWVCCMWTLGQSADCRDPPLNPTCLMPTSRDHTLWNPWQMLPDCARPVPLASRHDLRDELFPLLQLSHSASITAVEELSSEDAVEFEERITTRKAASNVVVQEDSVSQEVAMFERVEVQALAAECLQAACLHDTQSCFVAVLTVVLLQLVLILKRKVGFYFSKWIFSVFTTRVG